MSPVERARPRGRAGRWDGRPEEHDDHPRLFFAIPIQGAARDAVATVAERVRTSTDGVRARWVNFEGLHLTLRFLGPTPPEAVPSLADALADVARRAAPFEVALGGGGAFPDPGRPRTLWIGVTAGGAGLEALAAAISEDDRVAPLLAGRPLDGRPAPPKRFAPHLTIARTDGIRGASALAWALQAEAAGFEARFTADRVVLYRSMLGSGPARYTAVHEAMLGA